MEPHREHSDRREVDGQVVSAFGDITTEAITSARLEDLLRHVGERLCELIGVNRCSVYLRRKDGRFRGVTGAARGKDLTAGVSVLTAGGPRDLFTQAILQKKAAVLVTDVPHDPHRTPAMDNWDVRSMLGVPLVFDDEVIGIIYVDNEGAEFAFSADDITLAEIFSRLAALFVRQAILNQQARAKTAQAMRQRAALQYLADTHNQMSRAVLEGADIPRIVELLSEFAGKPVVLYDNDFVPIAWSAPDSLHLTSPPLIQRRILNMPTVKEVLRDLSVSRPSGIIPPTLAVGLGRRQLMCALVIEGHRNGYLSVVEIGRGLNEMDAGLAERAATVLSLLLLSGKRQIEAEGQARSHFLSELLRGSRNEETVRRGPQFGVDFSRPHILVRISFADDKGEVSQNIAHSMILRRLRFSEEVTEPPTVSVPGAVIILLRVSDAGALDELRAELTEIVAKLRARLPVRSVVISDVCTQIEHFANAHKEMRDIDGLAKVFGWSGRVLAVSELGLLRLVVSGHQVADAVRFGEEFMRPIRECDATGQLLETYRAFIDSGAKVQATAARLKVHENTVRYRLARIKDVVGKDPADFEVLLTARFSFQILDFCGADQPSD